MGLPVRLLAPPNWDQLGHELGGALRGLSALAYPYRGGAAWSRLVILLGLPVSLGLAAALAFWPARRAVASLRVAALVVLVVTYGVGATVSPPGAPLLHGIILLALLAAWLWLPGLEGSQAIAAAAVVAVAGLLALPVASRLDGARPWLDYRNWNWNGSAAGAGESFDWNHTYGPLDWTRTGETLLDVSSDAPHYWRTAELDRFDGYRWLETTASGNGAVELPVGPTGSQLGPQTVRLNPSWIHTLSFTVRGLTSQLVVAAGTPLGVRGLDDASPIQGGLALPSNDPLSDGDSYAIRAYIPDPTAGADAPRFPMPTRGSRPLHRSRPSELARLPPGAPGLGERELFHPGQPASADGALLGSFGSAGRRSGPGSFLVRRGLPAHPARHGRRPHPLRRREEDRVLSSLQLHVQRGPAATEAALAGVPLLRDGIGYCQQFSGAMALMLRMIGIPARVASGFSPGTSTGSGTYVVRDFDAHSWVEVYFNDIGWVPFDPTPAAAPAQSQATGLEAHGARFLPRANPSRPPRAGNLTLRRSAPAASTSSSSSLWLVLAAIALLALAGIAAMAVRAFRNRRRTPRSLVQAQLRELEERSRACAPDPPPGRPCWRSSDGSRRWPARRPRDTRPSSAKALYARAPPAALGGGAACGAAEELASGLGLRPPASAARDAARGPGGHAAARARRGLAYHRPAGATLPAVAAPHRRDRRRRMATVPRLCLLGQ